MPPARQGGTNGNKTLALRFVFRRLTLRSAIPTGQKPERKGLLRVSVPASFLTPAERSRGQRALTLSTNANPLSEFGLNRYVEK